MTQIIKTQTKETRTGILRTQTKETKIGTLRIQKILEKDSEIPYYIGTFKAKNSNSTQVIIKRFGKFSMNYLEYRILLANSR